MIAFMVGMIIGAVIIVEIGVLIILLDKRD